VTFITNKLFFGFYTRAVRRVAEGNGNEMKEKREYWRVMERDCLLADELSVSVSASD
jgi:hypothetical protein